MGLSPEQRAHDHDYVYALPACEAANVGAVGTYWLAREPRCATFSIGITIANLDGGWLDLRAARVIRDAVTIAARRAALKLTGSRQPTTTTQAPREPRD